jgi:hypothetical protein
LRQSHGICARRRCPLTTHGGSWLGVLKTWPSPREVAIDLSRAVWYKSTFSNGSGGNCVEVASNLPGIVAIRDSDEELPAGLADA